MRVGIICSSNGGVFRAAHEVVLQLSSPKVRFIVATDRPCGVESFCEEQGVTCRRFSLPDNREFSNAVKTFFENNGGVDVVFLFFLRLVTEEIFNSYLTMNIHPSLLPAFKGFNPLRQAKKRGVRYLGATMHIANDTVDGGPIIAQSCVTIDPGWNIERLEKLSFLQKTGLMLTGIELLLHGDLVRAKETSEVILAANLPRTSQFNPSIRGKTLLRGFNALNLREGECLEELREDPFAKETT